MNLSKVRMELAIKCNIAGGDVKKYFKVVGVPPNAVIVPPPELECCKCGWLGNYSDLIAPTSDHEPSCPECLGDDFVEVEHEY